MDKKVIALGAAALLIAGAANAELKAFKVNGETVTVAEQKAIYDRAVQAGQPAGEGLERQVKNLLIQQTVLLQEANKAKIANKPDVKRAIENSRDQILIQGLAQDWAQKNPVSEADLKKAYDQDKAAYGDTEYQVRHILVKSADEAKKLIAEINKGASFAKLAAEKSLDDGSKDVGGILDWQSPSVYTGQLAEAIRGLKKGEMAKEPVQSPAGFHIVKVEDERPAQLFPKFEDRKEELRHLLMQRKVQQFIHEQILRADVKDVAAK